jgi:hypothetical protein
MVRPVRDKTPRHQRPFRLVGLWKTTHRSASKCRILGVRVRLSPKSRVFTGRLSNMDSTRKHPETCTSFECK